MIIRFQLNDLAYESEPTQGVTLAIPMDFDGPQPNHFGAPKASRKALKLGEFVGDTERGGSCNVDTLSMVPHCNGTHTESVGHIVNQDVFVGHHAVDAFATATLITVKPELWRDMKSKADSYRPPLENEDRVIDRAQLENAFDSLKIDGTTSLIIRTISSIQKRSVAYGEAHPPAFFTVEAMQLIVSRNYRHLLVDLPSVDRMFDDGLLTNHHLFWSVQEGTHSLGAESRQDKTITEMLLVPDDVEDGLYLLNLQVPALCSDAAPSRPVIYPVKRV